MKVLLADKFWYLKGGAERVVFETKRLLEANGDVVSEFAMRDPRNRDSAFRRFFVSPVVTDEVRFDWQGLRTAGRMLWSFEAARKFDALLGQAEPDVVHAHNIYHQISPSILPVARRRGVPVVMTLHDYHLISPNYGMYDRGRIVEPSKAHPYWDTCRRRLIGGSALKSGLSAFEGWLHRTLRVYDGVAKFVAPSEFVKRKVVEYGIDAGRVEVVPHAIDLEGRAPNYRSEDRVVFVGRLSPEKGVDTLLRAMKGVRGTACAIVGDGPERGRLERLAEELGLAGAVTFFGALHGSELDREIARAKAVVVPSQTYETFGLAALEAYAFGKPVIASRIGALPEVVREGETGLLFDPAEPEGLADCLRALTQDAARAEAMGRAGRRLAETEYAPGLHLDRIRRVYREAVEKGRFP